MSYARVTVFYKSFFLERMAQIFGSYFLQSEFKRLYQTLLLNLNKCGSCGIIKCFYCKKFEISCASCRTDRCKNCAKFFYTIEFFYEHTTKDQWDYLCNFSHDLLRVHSITKSSFRDIIPINSTIKNSCFVISTNNINDSVKIKKNNAIYFMFGNRKYRFFYGHKK